jgi:S-adenosylmethionine:tRNA ribosyltransferase-isomerase
VQEADQLTRGLSFDNISRVNVADFDFELPSELIAQEPAQERTAARLLHLDRSTGAITHSRVSELPAFLGPGDLLVVNNTRVFPARLLGRRDPSGGAVECVLLAPYEETGVSHLQSGASVSWHALLHPGQKLKPGARVVFEDASGRLRLRAEIVDRRGFGRRIVRLWTEDGSRVDEAVDAIGHVPLPPYIKRDDRASDRERYQTIFAQERGSVAAPTAGLHFTPALMAALRARGIEMVSITLHVGYGTFQPVRVETVEEHSLEPERYEITTAAADAINAALDDRRRVIAVGTTTTRTLEWSAIEGEGRVRAGRGMTGLFIYPGFTFRVLSGLMTNFHLPKSSLLMLVGAFAGRERVMAAYREAVRERYRFYSYGDSMLIT